MTRSEIKKKYEEGYISLDSLITEVYKQGRTDGRTKAIDEYTEILRPLVSEFRGALETNPYAFIDLDSIAEQLKTTTIIY